MHKSFSCHIKAIIGPGIICFKILPSGEIHYAFAWQLCKNKKFFMQFNSSEQLYIKNVAKFELNDPWYKQAAIILNNEGIEKFL